eukprot:TRINITY_DN9798_c6_g1_i1.p1 TRINITY_DN9798_c6_g1~~TRINITY_DN9798_c6_g1_i1.p1  ORF type:complete len:439 (+),score=65.88 TRINITY_DN9798_c6_g1_i1:68-1318(+)
MGCSVGTPSQELSRKESERRYLVEEPRGPTEDLGSPAMSSRTADHVLSPTSPPVDAQSHEQTLCTLIPNSEAKSVPQGSVAFAADGNLVAHFVAATDTSPRLRSVNSDSAPLVLTSAAHPGHSSPIRDLCTMGPGGCIIVTCADDSTICIWARSRCEEDFACRQRLRLQFTNPSATQVSTGPMPGLRGVRGSGDGLLVIASVADEELETEDVDVDAEFNENGGAAPSTSVGRVGIWYVPTGIQTACFNEHNAEVLCSAFTPSSDAIATGSRDGCILMWEPPRAVGAPRLVHRMQAQDSAILSCTFSGDGDWLASCDAGSLYVWDTKTGTCFHNIKSSDMKVPGVRVVSFVGQTHVVAAAAGVPRVIVLDVVSGAQMLRVSLPAPVSCASPWGRTCAAVGDVDGGLHVVQLGGLVAF